MHTSMHTVHRDFFRGIALSLMTIWWCKGIEIMARIKEIEERLKRWQAWYFTTAQVGALRSPRWDVKVDRSIVLMSFEALTDEEACETDRAVGCFKKIVRLVYLDPEGRTMEVNARLLKMSRVSLY